jgi:hypothetical protein
MTQLYLLSLDIHTEKTSLVLAENFALVIRSDLGVAVVFLELLVDFYLPDSLE